MPENFMKFFKKVGKRKYAMPMIALMLIVAAFFSVCILDNESVYAAEKQISVDLDKEYLNCVFKLTFDTAGTYEASLSTPDENTYEFTTVDDTTMTCNLEKAVKGSYTVNIHTEDEAEIGKATLAVTTNKVSTTNIVDNNIMVGKSISGLKIYFKDDQLLINWTDETCGAVNVQVIDLDTSETIKSEKVTDKNFECDINKSVQKISVKIVPSSSASITGAELMYTLDTNFAPDANVVFPDIKKTNQSEVSVHIALGKSYSVYVEDNDKCVLTTDTMIAGEYDIKVPVDFDGTNDIKFYIVDENGNMTSYPWSIYKDVIAPSLSLEEEYDGMKVDTDTITIAGNVANYDTFKLNDQDIDVSTDGHFEKVCSLHLGDNTFHIIAADDSGNETSYDITIIMEEKKDSFSWQSILAIIAGILVLIKSSYDKKKKRKAEQQNKENIDEEEDSVLLKEDQMDADNDVDDLLVDPEDETEEIGTGKTQDSLDEDKPNKNHKLLWHFLKKDKKTNDIDEEPTILESDDVANDQQQAEEEEATIHTKKHFNIAVALKTKQVFFKKPVDTQKDEILSENERTDDTESKKEQDPIEEVVTKVPQTTANTAAECKAIIQEYEENVSEKEQVSIEEPENTQSSQQTQTVINIITDHKPRKKRKVNKGGHLIADILHGFVIVLIVFIIFKVLLLNGSVASKSMEPTLCVGDITIANRIAYSVRTPERGDIIFFKEEGKVVSKRVIGIGGDVVTFSEGKVSINGELLDESAYLQDDVVTECDNTYEVPQGEVFVLGDNRQNSNDSRFWTEPYVKEEDIIGKLMITIPLHMFL